MSSPADPQSFTSETPHMPGRIESVGAQMTLTLPKGKNASKVETRKLAPEALDLMVPETVPALRYRATPQIEGSVPMRVSFVRVSPEQARQWIFEAEQDPTFRQRRTNPRDVKRWHNLMTTNRFIEYLPDGPLCFDDNGIQMNGKHRMSALGQLDRPLGFMVVKHVPRWMFPYFDTGRVRSLNDVFTIANRGTKTQTGSTMRLAMRYEEMLFGTRPAFGWRDWAAQRDEHHDVDDFLSRRDDLRDYYQTAQRIYQGSRVIIAAANVFRYYQGLAWPDGTETIDAFCDGLIQGAMLTKNHPALVLREWAKDTYLEKIRVEAKREVHLLLLFRHFQLSAQNDTVRRVTYANGMPMSMPYHPKGPEVAVQNVIDALTKLDAEHEQ